MQPGDREAFEVILAELFAALDKPLMEVKRDAFWKGLAKMSIIEFSRCRDLLLEEMADCSERKTFGVSDIWLAKRRLRAAPSPRVDSAPKWTGDHWDEKANIHLLGYVLRQCQRKHYYDVYATKILVQYKNNWARDMREGNLNTATGECEALALAEQQRDWTDCMARAEEAIAQKVAA